MGDRPSPFAQAPDGLKVRLKVTPKAHANRIGDVSVDGAFLKVSVTAAPEGGKANARLIGLLAKAWGLPKSRLAVTQGATSRRKTVSIEGDGAALMERVTKSLAYA
jgi:uncharacterized protein (TIGR00251 family)